MPRAEGCTQTSVESVQGGSTVTVTADTVVVNDDINPYNYTLLLRVGEEEVGRKNGSIPNATTKDESISGRWTAPSEETTVNVAVEIGSQEPNVVPNYKKPSNGGMNPNSGTLVEAAPKDLTQVTRPFNPYTDEQDIIGVAKREGANVYQVTDLSEPITEDMIERSLQYLRTQTTVPGVPPPKTEGSATVPNVVGPQGYRSPPPWGKYKERR